MGIATINTQVTIDIGATVIVTLHSQEDLETDMAVLPFPCVTLCSFV